MDSLARVLLPEIRKMYESEEVRREFQIWLAERQKSKLNNTKEEFNGPVETKGIPQDEDIT